MVRLVELEDADFAWFTGNSKSTRPLLALPRGGVDAPSVLEPVRALTARVHAAGSRGAWMIVTENLVVGLCGYHRAPHNGVVEIGYSIAATCRNRGYATAAVAELIAISRASGIRVIAATTVIENAASERVLERNGFQHHGTRVDPQDGRVNLWRFELLNVDSAR